MVKSYPTNFKNKFLKRNPTIRLGKMIFVIRETGYTNQNGDLVAIARGTAIYR